MLHIDALSVKMGSEATRARMLGTAALIAKHHHPDCLISAELQGRKNVSAVTPWVAKVASNAGEIDCTEHANHDSNNVNAASSDTAAIDPPRSQLKIVWGKKKSSKQNAVVPFEMRLPSPFHLGQP